MPDNTQATRSQLSAALAERVAAARGLVAGIRVRGHSLRSGTLWRKDVVVASEQALPKAEEAEVVLADGGSFAARVAGRDLGTNVAVLRIDSAPEPAPLTAEEPRPGALVLALAADGTGGVAVRLGAVHSVGPAWHSRAGGRIDRRIALGWLGAAVQPVLVPEALHSEAGQPLGLMIIGVTKDGPAAQAGLLMGDILIGVDGAGVGSPRQLAELLGPESVGRQLQLRLIRAGTVQALTATVGARPAR